MRAFAETAPTRDLLATPKYTYVASAKGLDRWDMKTREVMRLSAAHGLPSSQN